ncbi:MAG: serine/threonine-protein kinase [Pseudoxanthomonas sp.]
MLRSPSLPASARQRFAREAELLARLEHPNIARLYAAGVADSEVGPLPWLAMERIHGQDLLAWANAQPAHGIDVRLAVLAAIARAVHYAHSRGVVHRDLKPANILIDAQGQPHVLDFGVAHLLQDDATATLEGQVLGSVPYMSREQLRGERAFDDPRSDVYALGVIAYQLLSGTLPYPGLSDSPVIEALALLRETRVERLSRRVPQARGDTETVVMKAMASEAAQRYDSAAELAADLERVRQRQPIAARAPTAGYVIGLFVRRHRTLAAALGIAALALLAATAISTHYALSESRARAEAERRSAETAAANRFLNDMLVSADPAHARGRALTVAEVLDPARRQLQTDRSLGTEARATLAATLARTYVALGDIDTGAAIARQALTTAETELGTQHPDAVRLRVILASALQMSGQLDEADKLLAPILSAPVPHGGDARPYLDARAAHVDDLMYRGDDAAALRESRAVLEAARATLPSGDPRLFEARQSYASLLFSTGEHAQAMADFCDLLAEEDAALGSDHPITMFTRMDYAERLRELGRYAEAETAIRQVVGERERVSGPQHYWTLMSQYVLCNTLNLAGRADEAQALIGPVVDGLRSTLGDASPETLIAMNVRADIERNLHHYADAQRLYREVIALRADTAAASHHEALKPVEGLGLTLIDSNQPEAGLQLLREALVKTDNHGPSKIMHARLLAAIGHGLMVQKKWLEARNALQQAQAIFATVLDAQHPMLQSLREQISAATATTEQDTP